MGKVLKEYYNGCPGAVSRSVDEVVISVKNAGGTDVPFGAPVFLTSAGAVPFNPESPQDFGSFLGFAVRVADMTPDAYPSGQDFTRNTVSVPGSQGAWKAGDVMEVLVRGGVVVSMLTAGQTGGNVYIRRSDGKLTPAAGAEGSTLLRTYGSGTPETRSAARRKSWSAEGTLFDSQSGKRHPFFSEPPLRTALFAPGSRLTADVRRIAGGAGTRSRFQC